MEGLMMQNNKRRELLKEYRKQKEIEMYQQLRVLPIPKTTYAHAIIWILLYLLMIIGMCVLSVFVCLPFAIKTIIALTFSVLFSDFYLRFLGVKIIECYQHYAKKEIRRRCLCVPSCSEYAILCLKKYELIKAVLKIRKRLFVTCKGDDYKIDLP